MTPSAKFSPGDSCGEMPHVETFPPVTIGCMETIARSL